MASKQLVPPKAYLGLPQDEPDDDWDKLAGEEDGDSDVKGYDQGYTNIAGGSNSSLWEPFGGIQTETSPNGKYYTQFVYMEDAISGGTKKVYLDLDEAGEPVWKMKPQQGTSKTYTVQKGDDKYLVTETWEPDEFGNMDVPTISIEQTVFAKEKELGEPPQGIDSNLWYNENLTTDDRNKLTKQSYHYMTDPTQEPPYNPGPNTSWQWSGRNWEAVVSKPGKQGQLKKGQLETINKGGYTWQYDPETGDYTIPVGEVQEVETPYQKSQREATETNQRLQAQEQGQRAFYEREAWGNNPRNPQVYNDYLKKTPLSAEYSPTAQSPSATLRGLIEALGYDKPFYNAAVGTTGERKRVTEGSDDYNLLQRAGIKANMPPDLASFLSSLPFNQQGLASLRPDQIAALEAAGSAFGMDWQNSKTGASTGEMGRFLTDVNIPFWEKAQKEQEFERYQRDPNAQAAFRSDMEKRALPFWEEGRRRTSSALQGGLAGSGRYR